MVPQIALVPSTLNLILYAGDGALLRLVITDPAGAPLVVDGAVAAQIREHRSDDAAAVEFSVNLDEGADGVVVISLSGAQTGALVDGRGKDFVGAWDVQWEPDGKEPLTLTQGEVRCKMDVTRP